LAVARMSRTDDDVMVKKSEVTIDSWYCTISSYFKKGTGTDILRLLFIWSLLRDKFILGAN
jgi:hypothetical protein